MLGRSYFGALERHEIIVEKRIDHSGVRYSRVLQLGAIGETVPSFRQQGQL